MLTLTSFNFAAERNINIEKNQEIVSQNVKNVDGVKIVDTVKKYYPNSKNNLIQPKGGSFSTDVVYEHTKTVKTNTITLFLVKARFNCTTYRFTDEIKVNEFDRLKIQVISGNFEHKGKEITESLGNSSNPAEAEAHLKATELIDLGDFSIENNEDIFLDYKIYPEGDIEMELW